MQDIVQHTQTVALTDSVSRFQKELPALPMLLVRNQSCEAVIAVQGAQVLQFKPQTGAELLWLSPNAVFAKGTAIRGGIPVCLPWFGVNQNAPSKPKHGFVRNQDWQLSEIQEPDPKTTLLVFTFASNAEDLALFPHPFTAQLQITLSNEIELKLTLHNHSDSDAEFSWALHSYHPVADLASAAVTGLSGLDYLDNLRGLQPTYQDGNIRFSGEVDRVYESVPTSQQILGEPAITIRGHNCETAIVWNPGAENAAAMNDVGEGIHQQFICVERGAAFGNRWVLVPNESRQATLQITGSS
ncbi:D-hexose-6-phosphate mutarotase [Pontibacterium sp. N1Y112]|uniref:Putative glucose-6-phosphate 1-epimerase n=1 Tax=Pontibacterium sinense TaxID=2781979 RepID=A0A8J7F6D1_9GAMM|nr:D-hexose-6-phosphate mutarotase [Pontibacterium sinense]MBE9395920.1 D-hexose-6-phosphate mutarotase [Pontibacterium sinense]